MISAKTKKELMFLAHSFSRTSNGKNIKVGDVICAMNFKDHPDYPIEETDKSVNDFINKFSYVNKK